MEEKKQKIIEMIKATTDESILNLIYELLIRIKR